MTTLDIPAIAALLGVSAKTVRDRLVHRPDFPAPLLAAGPRSRRWCAAEVTAWATPAARRSPAPSRGSTPAAAATGHDAR
jgi:predicted DNA-binding transcriptional regulator AlpA